MTMTTKTNRPCSHCGGSGQSDDFACRAPYLEDELSDGETFGIGLFVVNVLAATVLFATTTTTFAAAVTIAAVTVELLVVGLRRHLIAADSQAIPRQHSHTANSLTANSAEWRQVHAPTSDDRGEPSSATTINHPPASTGLADGKRSATSTSSEPFALDIQELERKRRETMDVQGLLAELPLTADAKRGVAAEPAAFNAEALLAKLPEEYASFARSIFQNTKWSRSDFSQQARSHGVMADAALDCINEAAQELLGDLILIDENETIQLNPDVAVSA